MGTIGLDRYTAQAGNAMNISNPQRLLYPYSYVPTKNEIVQSIGAWVAFTSSICICVGLYDITLSVESASKVSEWSTVNTLSGTPFRHMVDVQHSPTLIAGKTYAVAVKVSSGTYLYYASYVSSVAQHATLDGTNPFPDVFGTPNVSPPDNAPPVFVRTKERITTNINQKKFYTMP